MPTMANIVVKNAAAASVTFTALSGSAGDRSPARWRYDGDGTAPNSTRPSFSMLSKDNGPRTARQIVMDGAVPFTYTDAATGLKVAKDRVPIHVEITLPTSLPASFLLDAGTMLTNLVASALAQASIGAGTAPTGSI